MSYGPALTRIHQERLERWVDWSRRITRQAQDLDVHRQIWTVMNKALGERDGKGIFHEHYTSMYVTQQAMTLRRMVDLDRESVSLARLLTELAEHPEALTRTIYVSLYPGDVHLREVASDVFDRYADAGSDNLDPGKVRADLENWKSTCGPIRLFVNKTIAHLSNGPVPAATFSQLNKAIDTVTETTHEYHLLLHAIDLSGQPVTIQDDWMAPFREPLFES